MLPHRTSHQPIVSLLRTLEKGLTRYGLLPHDGKASTDRSFVWVAHDEDIEIESLRVRARFGGSASTDCRSHRVKGSGVMLQGTEDYFSRQTKYDGFALNQAFERALVCALPSDEDAPGHLHAAMRHAVLNGGKRIRPRLMIATAEACFGRPLEEDEAELVLRAAIAVELIHSASLVHDDLPCFDDADLRRGKPTVHKVYSVPLAVLAGDALITQAFEIIADYEGKHQRRALQLARILARATGSQRGIIGGQSLELAPQDNGMSMEFVEDYHEKKTAALFDFSMRAAAIATGESHEQQEHWGDVGIRLGLAFQLIDDLLDLYLDEEATGKTTGRDRALQRPNGALVEGSNETVKRLSRLIDEACGQVFELARKPDPVLRLMESFDSMLMKVEISGGHAGEAGAPKESRNAAQSGIFTARVAAAAVG